MNNKNISFSWLRPKWTPGKQRGKEVRCRYTIPVTYRLN